MQNKNFLSKKAPPRNLQQASKAAATPLPMLLQQQQQQQKQQQQQQQQQQRPSRVRLPSVLNQSFTNRAGSPAYSVSSPGQEQNYVSLFGSDEDDILEPNQTESSTKSKLIDDDATATQSLIGLPAPLRRATQQQTVIDVFERYRLRDSLLSNKIDTVVKGSTAYFSSDGAPEGSERMPVWSCLMTDLSLKHLAVSLASKVKKAKIEKFCLSFRGESHITDAGIRWLCEILMDKDANRAKTLTVDLDIRQCAGLTVNSATMLLNTFSPNSTVRSDLLLSVPDSPTQSKPNLSAALSVSTLLFVTPPELQYSPLRTVKECRLRPAVRGTAADGQFMEAGERIKVAAVELCLSAYNTQFFTSQPDQVVIAVENDLDSAAVHIAACLMNFVSRENPLLRKQTTSKLRLGIQQPASPMPAVSREAPLQLKAPSKMSLLSKKMPSKSKAKKSKAGMFEEAQNDLEMLQSEYQDGEHLQRPAILERTGVGYCAGAKVEQGWVLPLLSQNGAFLSKEPLKPATSLCGFAVHSACRASFTAGIGKLPAKFFEDAQLAQFQDQLERTAGVVLIFSEANPNEYTLECSFTKPDGGRAKIADIPLSSTGEFQLSIEVASPSNDTDVCYVSVFSNQDLVQKFQVARSSLFSKDPSELTHGFVSWAASHVSDKMAFYQLDKAPTREESEKQLSSSVASEASEIADLCLHRTRYRILCRRIDRARGGAEKLRLAVEDAMKANAAALEAASAAAVAGLESESSNVGQSFEIERRAAESLAAAERIRRFLRTRFEHELDIFDAESDSGSDGGGLRDLRQALIETAVAAFSELASVASAQAQTAEFVIAACQKMAKEKSGRRLVTVDQLGEDYEIDSVFLTNDLDWLHQRGLIVYLKRLRFVVTDPPWFFNLLESLPFEPPLVAGPLLPGLSPGAGVWSQLELEKSLLQAGLTAQEMDLLISIFKDSGALLEVIPIRESPADDKLFYTNMFCAAAKQLDWPVKSASDAEGLGLAAVHRWYRGLNLSADRILPALSSLTSHLGSLCSLSARGFVRSLWGVEVVVHFDDEQRLLRLTAYRPADAGAKAGANQQLLWSALHLFTDCADCLMMRHGVIAETGASDGEPENCSAHSEHCWESQQPDGESQQSVCSLCGSCSSSGSDCAFNRIDSGSPGRCLCGSLGARSCEFCGICGRCASRLWAVSSAVRPSRVLPGYVDDGDVSDSSRCVRLSPGAVLQSELQPEITFSLSPNKFEQTEISVFLWQKHTRRYLEIYPKLSKSQTDAVFSTNKVVLEEPINISCRLSALGVSSMNAYSSCLPVDDAMHSAATERRFSFALKSFCSVWQETGLAFYCFNAQNDAPVATLIAERRLTRQNNAFEICIESKGVNGNISVGVVPADFPVMAQPGSLPGSVGYSGKDGRLLAGHAAASSEPNFKFSGPQAPPACRVRCQLQYLGPSRVRVQFLVDKLGIGSFETCHFSDPLDVPPTGLYPCVTMQSPREAVRLISQSPWLPASYADQLPMGVMAGMVEDPIESASVARIFPQDDCLLCFQQATEKQVTFAAVVALQLLAPGQTEVKVTSSRHVLCSTSPIDIDSAAASSEEDNKRTTVLVLTPKEKVKSVIFNVLVVYPKALDAKPDAQSLEFAEFLRKECSLEISLDNKAAGHQEKRLRFDLQPEMSRDNSAPLVALKDSEENRKKLSGLWDLLEVFQNGVSIRKVLVPRRSYGWVFNASADVSISAPNFPAVNYSRRLSPGDWVRLDRKQAEKPGHQLCRVIKMEGKSITLQPLDASASPITVDADAEYLSSPTWIDRINLTPSVISDPALPAVKFPSPNALPRWNESSDLADGSILYGKACLCAAARTPAGFGRSLLTSLTKKASVGHGLLWVFLPDLTRDEGRPLRQPCILDVSNPDRLRAHLLCNSGSAADVHLVDSPGVRPALPSALDCHRSAEAAIRALMQHRLLLPSHELLAGPGHCRPVVEAAVKRLLMLGAALSHWDSLFSAPTTEHTEGIEALKERLSAEFAKSADGPLFLQTPSQQDQETQPMCGAHQLTGGNPALIDELIGSAAEGEAAVAAALQTFGSCVRSAVISSRLIKDTSCLTSLSGLETLQLHRMEKMRSLDKSWPMQRLRSLTVTQSDLETVDCNAPNLQSLTVSIAKVSRLPETCSSKLESLTLDRCLITSLPASIGQLERLTVLHLQQLPIRNLPPEFANLRSLQVLVIDGIAWPDKVADGVHYYAHVSSGTGHMHFPLDNPNLRSSKISLAGLETLPSEQEFFSFLVTDKEAKCLNECRDVFFMLIDVPRLGLESTNDDQLGGIPPCLFELANLRELRLSHHVSKMLSEKRDKEQELKGLSRKSISGKLANFRLNLCKVPDKIRNLKKLKRLLLDHNPLLKSLSPCLSELPQLTQVDVSRCPSLQTPPAEVAKRGSGAILSYLKFLASEQVECKRTKLMFVGLGGVGKTSLLRALRSPTGTTGAVGVEEITDGIDIGDWQIDVGDGSPPLHFSTWDFAGQRVYYNTHQFFLTHRAVYLLLYTVRTGYEHAGLNFWLSSIASHAPKAPVLVVGTHADQVEKPDKIPMEMFKLRYPQICGFHIISSHSGRGISDLRKQLVEVALKQPYMSERLPRIYLDFEDRLMEKRTRDHINILDWQEVVDLAQSQGLYEDRHVRQAVSFLNDIGSVQYFDTDYLRNKVVINPKWIVDVMACVVSVKNSPIQNGQLKKSDIPSIWSKFDPALHDWLLKLTEAFDLTYAMKDDCNIVPCLLPEDVPEYSFPQEADGEGNTLARFIYQFDYLPAGLFNRAQVRLFEFTDSNTIWKRGSLLRKDAHIAVITMDDHQSLVATVFGPRPENVLFMINDVFDSLIQETFHGVHYEEILPCPECLNSSSGDSERSVIRVAMIRKASSRQVSFLQCPFEFHILNLSQLLASIRPESLTEFDHQLEQSLLRLRRARLEMTRDVCLLFLDADFPNDGADKGPTCPEAVAKKLEAEGISCYPAYPEQQEDRQLHMSDCSAVLVFLTKSFGSDKACLSSLFSAKNSLRKKLVFLSVGQDKSWRDCNELAFLVGTDKYIDLTDAKKSVIDKKLAEAVADTAAAVEAKSQMPNSAGTDSRDKDVFISYCWANSHDAVAKGTRNGVLGCQDSDPRRLRERLEAEGIRCWLDVKDTGARSLFEDISSGLNRCPLVLAFVSDEYQRSANCMMEFRFAAKNLRKPIVTVVVGQSQVFKTQELGMLSLGCEEFDFRKDAPASDFNRLVATVKSLLASEAEKKTADKPLMHRKTTVAMPLLTQPGLFREEAELAQRRFLKQFSHTDQPRLLVPDFSDVTDFSDDSHSKSAESGKLEELMLIRVLCENQRGWHVHGPAVSIQSVSKTGREAPLPSASVYLLRFYSLLQASGIRLNCLEGVQAEDFMQAVRVEAAASQKSFAESYRVLQQLFMDAAKADERHSGLSKCALGSGKILWLCPEHQRAGNGRVTVLPAESSGAGAMENLFTAGEAAMRDLLLAELDKLKKNEERNEAVKKYMKYLDEQEKYIASKKHLSNNKEADEARRRLQRHRTSVAIGQLEAVAVTTGGKAGETSLAKAAKPQRRAATGDKAEAEALTASQVSLKKNRSKVCSLQ